MQNPEQVNFQTSFSDRLKILDLEEEKSAPTMSPKIKKKPTYVVSIDDSPLEKIAIIQPCNIDDAFDNDIALANINLVPEKSWSEEILREQNSN